MLPSVTVPAPISKVRNCYTTVKNDYRIQNMIGRHTSFHLNLRTSRTIANLGTLRETSYIHSLIDSESERPVGMAKHCNRHYHSGPVPGKEIPDCKGRWSSFDLDCYEQDPHD